MNQAPQTGHLSVSWPRKQSLKAIAVLQDYPKASLTVIALTFGTILFYLTQLNGLEHFNESFSRWRVENFGGEHPVDRAARVPDVLLSFPNAHYDRVDVLSMTSIHFGGRAFRKEIEEVMQRGGIIRVVGLDPRVGNHDHPNNKAFVDLAKAFDEELWEFRARCWHSAAVLVHLNQQLGERFQVRLMAESITGARAPYMSPGRWSHSYRADNRGERMDVIIERPDIADGTDSFSHKARVFRNRPDDPTVALFATAFEEAWRNGTLLDEILTQALLETLDGPEAR